MEDPDPPYLYPDYRSTVLRSPSRALIPIRHTLSEITGPLFDGFEPGEHDADLTRQHEGAPIGQRIVVAGRVLDGGGAPIPRTVVEAWQANSAGRYDHAEDQHDAPLDPHFTGGGRAVTDGDGWYRFVTIQPGAYPWKNHPNAWRPAHIHFSLFGPSIQTRLITQMYFPGDPLLPFDPILTSIPESSARDRLVAAFDWSLTEEAWALGFRFDIVLAGRYATPFETSHDD